MTPDELADEQDIMTFAEAIAAIQRFAESLATIQMRVTLSMAAGIQHPRVINCGDYRLLIVPDDLGKWDL